METFIGLLILAAIVYGAIAMLRLASQAIGSRFRGWRRSGGGDYRAAERRRSQVQAERRRANAIRMNKLARNLQLSLFGSSGESVGENGERFAEVTADFLRHGRAKECSGSGKARKHRGLHGCGRSVQRVGFYLCLVTQPLGTERVSGIQILMQSGTRETRQNTAQTALEPENPPTDSPEEAERQ